MMDSIIKLRPLLLVIPVVFSSLEVSCQEIDSLNRRVKVSIQIDYGKLITSFSDFESKYEIGTEIIFDKLALLGSIGYANLTPESAFSNADYQSNGRYFRIALGYTKKFKNKFRYVLSLGYGVSFFEEEFEYRLNSPSKAQDDYIERIVRENLSADWLEINFATEQKFSKSISLGVNIGFRRITNRSDFNPIDIYSIPGYGRSLDKSLPVINVFLKIYLY